MKFSNNPDSYKIDPQIARTIATPEARILTPILTQIAKNAKEIGDFNLLDLHVMKLLLNQTGAVIEAGGLILNTKKPLELYCKIFIANCLSFGGQNGGRYILKSTIIK